MITTLSRTSRILIGLLLLAVAAFVWLNFLFAPPALDDALLSATPAPRPTPGPTAEAPRAQADGATVSPGGQDTAAGGPAAAGTDAAGLPVVAPIADSDGSGAPAVARDLVVAELPFLITEPPPAPTPAEQDARAEGVSRPGAGRRANINPFSPVVLAPAAPALAEQPVPPAPESEPVITEVPIPAAPPAAAAPAPVAEAVKPPAPRVVAPAAPAASLPRALPSASLSSTPQLLRESRAVSEVPTADLARLAPEPEPGDTRAELPGTETDAGASSDAGSDAGSTAVDQPAEATEPAAEAGADVEDQQAARPRYQASDPLAAGVTPLSRYLRDNNVTFTGSVLGPVSVGVFRSARTAAPIVISLGQNLPDTEIVLTDLRGQQAQFTLDGASQTLTLDLRR